jgi:2-hydroxy fatty acid dioxygenase
MLAENVVRTVPKAYLWAHVLSVTCWVAQIAGHFVFEGRSPAFLDNLLQAFTQAPFFVWMEGCWAVSGMLGMGWWRARLRKSLEAETIKRVAAYRKSKTVLLGKKRK